MKKLTKKEKILRMALSKRVLSASKMMKRSGHKSFKQFTYTLRRMKRNGLINFNVTNSGSGHIVELGLTQTAYYFRNALISS